MATQPPWTTEVRDLVLGSSAAVATRGPSAVSRREPTRAVADRVHYRDLEALDHPVPEHVIDHAIACAERRIAAHDDERAKLVHGDVHQWNALESHDGFKLIDPDGLLAEPEYDLGIIMREDPLELLDEGPWPRAHRLASATSLDPVATWGWGVVERISTGLLCTQIDLQPVGRQMLAAATYVADV